METAISPRPKIETRNFSVMGSVESREKEILGNGDFYRLVEPNRSQIHRPDREKSGASKTPRWGAIFNRS